MLQVARDRDRNHHHMSRLLLLLLCVDASQLDDFHARVGANESCTVSAAIAAPAVGLPAIADQYAPCPQLLMRQPYGPWDVVVVQDQSSLPFVHAARCAGALES